MFERFTDRARKVMALANQEAQRFNHEYIGTEHILLGVIKEGSGTAALVLKNLCVDLRKVRLEVEKRVKAEPDRVVTMGKLPQTPQAKKVFNFAIEEARNFNHTYIGTEHLLLGLVREHDGVAAQVLLALSRLNAEETDDSILDRIRGLVFVVIVEEHAKGDPVHKVLEQIVMTPTGPARARPESLEPGGPNVKVTTYRILSNTVADQMNYLIVQNDSFEPHLLRIPQALLGFELIKPDQKTLIITEFEKFCIPSPH